MFGSMRTRSCSACAVIAFLRVLEEEAGALLGLRQLEERVDGAVEREASTAAADQLVVARPQQQQGRADDAGEQEHQERGGQPRASPQFSERALRRSPAADRSLRRLTCDSSQFSCTNGVLRLLPHRWASLERASGRHRRSGERGAFDSYDRVSETAS